MNEKWNVDAEFLKKVLKTVDELSKRLSDEIKERMELGNKVARLELDREVQKTVIPQTGRNALKFEVMFRDHVSAEDTNMKGMNIQREIESLVVKYNVKSLKIDINI